MNIFKKISPEWSLRIAIGAMYLYSGQDIFLHPRGWTWALPYWTQQLITSIMPLDAYLRIQGAVEILMALVLLAWFLKPAVVKWAALLSALEMAGILILAFAPFKEANFLFTFRDIGLLGGSLALAILLLKKEENSASQNMV